LDDVRGDRSRHCEEVDMANLIKLSPFTEQGLVRVVIETPKSARVKMKYEPDLRAFAYDRPLPAGLAYPYDWGFVPATLGEDGDPLDGMVVHDAATFPGTVFECRPLAVLQVEQTENGVTVRNDRYLFRPANDGVHDTRELSSRDRRDLQQFFTAAVIDTDKTLKFLGWADAKAANQGLRTGAKAFSQKRAKK
jgi:inorganic pyrophosphatase